MSLYVVRVTAWGWREHSPQLGGRKQTPNELRLRINPDLSQDFPERVKDAWKPENDAEEDVDDGVFTVLSF